MISAASYAACTIATSTALYLMCITALFATSCSFSPSSQGSVGDGSLNKPAGDFSPVDYTVFHSAHLQAPTESSFSMPTRDPSSEYLEWNWDWGPGTDPDRPHYHTCPWLSQSRTIRKHSDKYHKKAIHNHPTKNFISVSNHNKTERVIGELVDLVEVPTGIGLWEHFNGRHQSGLVYNSHAAPIVVN